MAISEPPRDSAPEGTPPSYQSEVSAAVRLPANQSAAIASVETYRVSQPLKTPYHLAFGTFEAFDVLLTQVRREDGRTAWGETTACPGYVPETGDEIWGFLCSQAPGVVGLTPEAAVQHLLPLVGHSGYPVAALLTAVEGVAEEAVAAPPSGGDDEVVVPLIGILSAETEAELEAGFWAQVERGFTTVKIKVGFDVDRDIQRVSFVQGLARQVPGFRIRIDANQGYTLDDARKFVRAIGPERVELFEQPFEPGDWDSQVALSRMSPLPLELDEGILSAEDVKHAAARGCAQFVKFKLMKAGGKRLLSEQIDLARRLGLKVVLGNGVAGEVGCYHEAVAHVRAALETAGEMNGFLKPRRSLLREPLFAVSGGVRVRLGSDPSPDVEKLSEMAVAHRSWPA